MSDPEGKLCILQVSTSDVGGGAERSASNLFHAYRVLGHDSWLAVGRKVTELSNIVEVPNDEYRNRWVRSWNRFLNERGSQIGRIRGLGRLATIARDLGQPQRFVRGQCGIEDFNFPGTRYLLELPHRKPDILHCHNLHGGYFDSRQLPAISNAVPTVLNIHDGWLLSGHCALSLDCNKWMTGCGRCPDLDLYPAIRRDATSYNWDRKKEIMQHSRFHVTTPSKWMMDMVDKSIVASSIVDARVIPNGVDTDTFFPGSRFDARERLGLPQDSTILMTASLGLRQNVWKDYDTIHGAIMSLGEIWTGSRLQMLVVGEAGHEEATGNATIQYIPYQKSTTVLADYYRAANLYIHAAKVESFGSALIEARACGTPVVTTAVGGIPEHVKSLQWSGLPSTLKGFALAEATGVLVSPGDGEALASAVLELLKQAEVLKALRENGIQAVRNKYSLRVQAQSFLNWFDEILSVDGRRAPSAIVAHSRVALRDH